MDIFYMLDMTSYSLHRHLAATLLQANNWQDLGNLSFKKQCKITLSGDYWESKQLDSEQIKYHPYDEFIKEVGYLDKDFKIEPKFFDFEDYLSLKKTALHGVIAEQKFNELEWFRDELHNKYSKDNRVVYLYENGFWYKRPNENSVFYPYNLFKTLIF